VQAERNINLGELLARQDGFANTCTYICIVSGVAQIWVHAVAQPGLLQRINERCQFTAVGAINIHANVEANTSDCCYNTGKYTLECALSPYCRAPPIMHRSRTVYGNLCMIERAQRSKELHLVRVEK
jgi:hypothetical protein